MKIRSRLFWKSVGLVSTLFIRTWMDTLDVKAAFYDPATDPAFGSEKRHFILLFWHEHILFPLFLRRNSDVTMLLSQHGDAEIVGQVAPLLGMNCIRGSSYRGGIAAIKQFMTLSRQTIMAFTPDGPRGPRRTLAPGAVFLASKLQIPVVLAGFGYNKFRRSNSWDKFVLPMPFARGRMILSGPLNVPPDLNKEGIEHYRKHFEIQLTRLTDEAEDWAVSGEPMEGESVLCPGPKCSLMYYGYDHQAKVREDERPDGTAEGEVCG